jgi:Glycosyl transferase family 8
VRALLAGGTQHLRSECSFKGGVAMLNVTAWREGNFTQQYEYWMDLQLQEHIYAPALKALPPALLVAAEHTMYVPLQIALPCWTKAFSVEGLLAFSGQTDRQMERQAAQQPCRCCHRVDCWQRALGNPMHAGGAVRKAGTETVLPGLHESTPWVQPLPGIWKRQTSKLAMGPGARRPLSQEWGRDGLGESCTVQPEVTDMDKLLHWSGPNKPWERARTGNRCAVDAIWEKYDAYGSASESRR